MSKLQAKIKRDQYYYYLMNKYNVANWEDVIDIITEEENNIREFLELKAM